MQRMVKIDSPIAGVILNERIVLSGATLSPYATGGWRWSSRIGLRIAQDLPARSAPYGRPIAPAIGSVSPAMENRRRPQRRLRRDRRAVPDRRQLVERRSGRRAAGDRRSDLALVEGVIWKNGQPVDRGVGSDVLGHPLEALVWLANHLIAQGDCVRAGDLVMTGSLVTTTFVAPENTIASS